MNLYSGTTCPLSHRCRIVLYEQGMDFQVIDLDEFDNSIIPESVSGIKNSEHNKVPVLEERDLALFDASVIGEFIDERFPHPQLMPQDPIMRARARQILLGFEREIFHFMMVLENKHSSERERENARKQIVTQLVGIVPIFSRQKYLQNVSNLSNADFYLCGNKMMISAMNNLLAANKVSEAKIFSDAF